MSIVEKNCFRHGRVTSFDADAVDEPRQSDYLISVDRSGTSLWRSAFARLAELRSLNDDWDGAGAAAPGPEVVDNAIEAARHLSSQWPPPTRIVPDINGAVCFEWEGDGGAIEVEISEEGAFLRSYRLGKNGRVDSRKLVIDDKAMRRAVAWNSRSRF